MEHHHDVWASYRCVLGCQLRSHLTATTHVSLRPVGGQTMATAYVAKYNGQEAVDSASRGTLCSVIWCRRVWVPYRRRNS